MTERKMVFDSIHKPPALPVSTLDPITEFLGAFSADELLPRGVVLGLDGLPCASVSHNLANIANRLAGWILRFNPNDNGVFVDVFASSTDADCAAGPHRPEAWCSGPMEGFTSLFSAQVKATRTRFRSLIKYLRPYPVRPGREQS